MRTLRIIAILTAACIFGSAALASAATVNLRKLKRWPAEDQAWARALDSWMSQDEANIFVKLKTTDERKDFLHETGYWRIWDEIEEEMLPHVIAGEVVKGMTKDEVFMTWDKPKKIRKDFRRNAYVDVFNYEFERDRKGKEFVLRPDSQTSYKNEVFTRFVYMHNGLVFAIVDEGYEEDVMDELPVADKPEVTPAPEPEPASEADADTTESSEEQK